MPRSINFYKDKPDIVDIVSDNEIYQGFADWGNPQTSEAKFLIRKITVVGTVTSFKLANGLMDCNQVWDNRKSLTYKFPI